ncbi:sensor histidine kinase [Umezawaea tangerina]|uniref:histidine kinase n=1 Tax=Umezawaea tangerina TaxID=84725 RepID=A0A2T0SXL4_9PSEU|nr:histidine kinase [Umezawaea tangerina]PRY38158.1 signal transduction histidine kinase [Umezawaea tangerina]
MRRLPDPARDLLIALGCFAVGAVLYRFNLYELWAGPSDTPFGWRLLVLGIACLGQLLRSRAPLVGAFVALSAASVDVALGLSAPVIIVLMDLLHVATLRGSKRTSQLIIGLVVMTAVGIAVGIALTVQDWRSAVGSGLQIFSVLVMPVWWAINLRQHRLNTEQVERISQLDRRAAVTAERTRMARDLHDVIAGHLSAIAIQSEAVLSMAARDPETVRTVLRSVRENSIQSLAEMRTMIDVLRADDEVPDEPASARLSELGRLVDSARAGGLRVELSGEAPTDLPVAVDLAAYRIVQESLTNALKHAPGARVEVALDEAGKRLAVTVTSEWRGASTPGTGSGLVGMAERAQAVGGTFDAGRVDDRWRVRAELPTGGARG